MGLPPDRDTKEAEEAPPPARRQPVFQSFCSGGTPAAVNYDPGGVGEEEHCARGGGEEETTGTTAEPGSDDANPTDFILF